MTGPTRRVLLGGAASIIVSLLAGKGWSQAPLSPSSDAVSLRILATSDLHGCLLSYDYYRDRADDRMGLARLATLIRAAGEETPNILLVDAGDLLGGNALAQDWGAKGLRPGELHPAIKAANILRYDVATLGSHDFDYGLPFLERAIAGAGFPYACANLLDAATGAPYFHPSVMIEKDVRTAGGATRRLRVGVIGLVTPQVVEWNAASLGGRLKAADIVEVAADLAPKLRAGGADLVVALCHSGFGIDDPGKNAEDAVAALSRIADIDVLVAGHSHRVFPDPSFGALAGLDLARGTLRGVPAVMPGAFGGDLGVIDLTLVPGVARMRVGAAQASVRPLRRSGVQPDPALMSALTAEHRAALAFARQPVSRTERPLHTYFALAGSSSALDLVAAVQMDAARAAVAKARARLGSAADFPLLSAVAPFRAGGHDDPTNFTFLPAGDLALANVGDLYLYPNFLEVVSVTGSGLREWLEMSATVFRQMRPDSAREQNLMDHGARSFDFDVVYGVAYRIDIAQPPRYRRGGAMLDSSVHRIVDLQCGGKPVADDDRFLVATNRYRAEGGGSFPGLDGTATICRTADVIPDLVAAWLRAHPVLPLLAASPWSLAPFGTDATVVLHSAPAAAAGIPPGSGISYLGPGEDADDFARYRVQPVS